METDAHVISLTPGRRADAAEAWGARRAHRRRSRRKQGLLALARAAIATPMHEPAAAGGDRWLTLLGEGCELAARRTKPPYDDASASHVRSPLMAATALHAARPLCAASRPRCAAARCGARASAAPRQARPAPAAVSRPLALRAARPGAPPRRRLLPARDAPTEGSAGPLAEQEALPPPVVTVEMLTERAKAATAGRVRAQERIQALEKEVRTPKALYRRSKAAPPATLLRSLRSVARAAAPLAPAQPGSDARLACRRAGSRIGSRGPVRTRLVPLQLRFLSHARAGSNHLASRRDAGCGAGVAGGHCTCGGGTGGGASLRRSFAPFSPRPVCAFMR
jgi:hypothetical protein